MEDGHEGQDGLVMYPRLAYVVQDEKVWFARGDATQLGESLTTLLESEGKVRTVVESADSLDLEERQLPDGSVTKLPSGRWFVEGVFQRSDVPNANKRKYPRRIWERLIGDPKSYAMTAIRERAMLGHLEHPADGRTNGKEGAILVVDAKLQEDGTVWGKAEVLDTPNGLILKEYTRKHVRWGVSSRGNGSVGESGEVDPDAYILETWDAVMKPSVPGAFPAYQGGKPTDEAVKRGESARVGSRVSLRSGGEGEVVKVQGDQLHIRLSAPGGGPPTAKTRVVSRDDVIRVYEAQENADGGKPSEQVTEGEDFVARVASLVETPVEDLDVVSRRAALAAVSEATEQCFSLHAQRAFTSDRAMELLDLMDRYRRALTSESDRTLDDVLDEALRDEALVGEEDTSAFTRVTDSLRQRLEDSVEESHALRERLEDAESVSIVAHQQVDEVLEQLSEVEGRLTATEQELALAEELLATRPEAVRSGAVTEATNEVIRQIPVFGEFRDAFMRCRDAREVEQLAERLLPYVVRTPIAERSEDERPSRRQSSPRRTLPEAFTITSEADVMTVPRRSSRDTVRGAVLAAQAVAIMEGRGA